MDLNVALVFLVIGVWFLWIAAGTRFIWHFIPEFRYIRLPWHKG